ncbi:hypothetical protein ACR34G_03555 [Mycoplasma sp. 480]|uniref:hypothetical protein n=1 Tax=Mycoplasma sp. 480 TaxID=3440155 RepID=UPI003F5192C8
MNFNIEINKNISEINKNNFENTHKIKSIDYKNILLNLPEKTKVRILKLADKVLNLKYEDFYKLSFIKFPKRSFERVKEEYKKNIFYNEIKSSLKTREYFISTRSRISDEATTFEELQNMYNIYSKKLKQDSNSLENRKKTLENISDKATWIGAVSFLSPVISGVLSFVSLGTLIANLAQGENENGRNLKYLNNLIEEHTDGRLVFLNHQTQANWDRLFRYYNQFLEKDFVKYRNDSNTELNNFLEFLHKDLMRLKDILVGYSNYYGNY